MIRKAAGVLVAVVVVAVGMVLWTLLCGLDWLLTAGREVYARRG